MYTAARHQLFVKGVLYSEIYFFSINFFLNMYIYTPKKQKLKKNNNKFLTERPKIRRLRVKDTAKTKKD